MDAEYDFLRENNRGLCAKTKKSFGELMEHFIVGLDEMCIMSDAHGTLRVIGSADKKNMRNFCKIVGSPLRGSEFE